MNSNTVEQKTSWNKGKLVGQKLPLNLKEIRAIRIRLQLAVRTWELAMFNLATGFSNNDHWRQGSLSYSDKKLP